MEGLGRERTFRYGRHFENLLSAYIYSPPPSISIQIKILSGEMFAVSHIYHISENNSEHLLHSFNVFLELFGSLIILVDDFERYTPATTKIVSWKLLPPGDYPWDKLEPHIELALTKETNERKAIIHDRVENIRGYRPVRVHVGCGGFNDYIAYEFPDRGVVVLESIRTDTALYIFNLDWERVSTLTKAEILRDELHLCRIIHSKGWKERLTAAMPAGIG